jgi:hypothetical protein
MTLVQALIMRQDIVDAIVKVCFVVCGAAWVLFLARLAHFPFWAAAAGGVALGYGTVMLSIFLLARIKKKH